jgi:hypothetical protein
LAAQNLDAEYIYTTSLWKQQQAVQAGLYDEAALYAQEAKLARQSLLQFSLSGLWVGKYNDDTFQLINVTYIDDVLTAYKITSSSTCHVPQGEITFQVDLTPPSSSSSSSSSTSRYSSSSSSTSPFTTTTTTNKPSPFHFSKQYTEQYSSDRRYPNPSVPTPQYLEPIQLHNPEAMEQWGIQYLQRHVGLGQVATTNYQNPQYVTGQLILINEQYFSFVWIPTQHHVFFGRPSPELVLKLLRENEQKNLQLSSGSGENQDKVRQYLERCYEETLLMDEEMGMMDDDNDDTSSVLTSHDPTQYYNQDGCFE